MRYHHFLTVLFILISLVVKSQNISVKSFNELTKDMEARVNEVIGPSGDICALIKVVTTQKGFVFEGDMNGITKTINQTGEIWIYLPYGSKRLTIKHEKLGVLRNYIYPIPIKKATVYEMVLTTAKVTTIVEEYEIPTGFLVVTSDQESADVFIDDVLVGSTTYQKKMEVGRYKYRIEKSMYHNDAGIVEIFKDSTKFLHANLKPNFGYVKINTFPEQDVSIEIDHIEVNGKTPYASKRLASGEHHVTLKKVMYKTKTERFTIQDGQTTNLNVELEPDFAKVNITTNPEAKIYIDGKFKSFGTYSGRLVPGIYDFEAKKDKYYSDKSQKDVKAGDSLNLSLHARAKTGNVDILTNPPQATIKLNGKDYGKTPKSIEDLLIGDYTLLLEKEGFNTIKRTILLIENQTKEIKETLTQGLEIDFTSNLYAADLYEDDAIKGKTALKLTLTFGKHNIKIVDNGIIKKETINVTPGGQTFYSFIIENEQKVSIVTNPTGYLLKINGISYGETPRTISLASGKYEIKFIKGGKEIERNIVVARGEKNYFRFDLTKELSKKYSKEGVQSESNKKKLTAKEFFKEQHFLLTAGYHNTSFNNETFKDNLSNGIINQELGYAASINFIGYPFVFNLSYFSSEFSSDATTFSNSNIWHRGGETAINLIPFSIGKNLHTSIGIGYQLSQLYTDSDEPIAVNTNGPIAKGALMIRINKFIMFGEYKFGFAITNENNDSMQMYLNSTQMYLGIGLFF